MTRPEAARAQASSSIPEAVVAEAKAALVQKHGEAERSRIERGVDQVRPLWRPTDGDPAAFKAFVTAEFLPKGERLDAAFGRLEYALERLGGYFTSLSRDLRRGADLEIGPLVPLDERLAGFDPGAHLSEDLFQSRIAFVALLNFPLTTLDQRLKEGGGWTREQWAEARLAQRFDTRVPAEVNAATAQAYAEAGSYVAAYNVYTHHVLTADGQRLFPAGQRLLSHWNLRDEIKARYSDADGAPKQRLIAKVMDAIVQQTIPAAVVNNPLLDWTPETGAVVASPVKDADPPAGAAATPSKDRENDERYRRWMLIFQAERKADPHHPLNPTFIDRRFNLNREIPEAEVAKLLQAVLDSPLSEPTARLIEKRLGRKLEPFDIWYAGFKPRAKHTEADLDALTRKRYPTAADYAADIPRLLKGLGFSDEKARFVAERIVVEPARGSGHAFGGARRDDKAHLRTRIGSGGMDYKGYNIAIHEMGHNVEQVFSVSTIDHTLLMGVPNTAFTEALAFVFQARDLPLLGLGEPDPEAQRLRALEEFWATREIAAVGLLDMAAWRWLYAHPDATPAQFREAVVAISRDVWNRNFASLFGQRDVTLLGIYSHAVDSGLYLPDYGLGHLIAFQVEEHFAKVKGPLGPEFERVTRIGSVTPDAWMRQAVGAPLSAQPLLDAARRALDATAK
ncbi:MAG TPA: hypothetical protein VFQ51_03995 [Vicinamibacteria bacterium]|nr:hypothetical protein [Vicinamibacteria bacterium]